MSKKILICSSPDLNYIDGSSIWAQTITLAMANVVGTKVDFLVKSTPQRQELYAPILKQDNVNIIDGTAKKYWEGSSKRRLSLVQMAELTVQLHDKYQYDAIIVRGLEIAQSLIDSPDVLQKCWLYLTDIPQSLSLYSPSLMEVMRVLATNCQFVLCQTIGFVDLWQELAPSLPSCKFKIYAPVIPDIDPNLIAIENRAPRVIYAGKFKSDWKTLEMAQAWEKVYALEKNSELLMVGDKIHREKNDLNYYDVMSQALENTEGLFWLGAKSREEVQALLKTSQVGLSWRSESMNETLEYSTKILEYGGAGCASILNRNALHESLLGCDYPLYANSDSEFIEKLLLALNNKEILKMAANRMYKFAQSHTFSLRVNELALWLDEAIQLNYANRNSMKTILVAGHDLKFFYLLQKRLEETGQYQFITDQWLGHNKHDEFKSLELLKKADIIFCEWCLGNLEWYSKHKKASQQLVARFHAQESKLPYLLNANIQAIDHISFVSEHIREEALMKVPMIPKNKTSIIANYLDDTKFTPLKKMGDAQFALGMVGVTPKGKRLDRALDLLEALLEKDNRYYLRVKGKNPLSYSWIYNRPEEITYYKEVLRRINTNPLLRYKVIFDPPGDDVNQWLSLVGYILSPSDSESFHMAIGEGILAGCYPIIWNWKGSTQIWGENFVINNVQSMVDLILSGKNKSKSVKLSNHLKSDYIVREWHSVLGKDNV